MSDTHRSPADVRARLGHPVVDADGHMAEIGRVVLDYIRTVGGQDMAERYRRRPEMTRWYRASPEERQDERITARPWWGMPTKNTLDGNAARIAAPQHSNTTRLVMCNSQ